MKKESDIAILYPHIAHYREDFFKELLKYHCFDIFTYINNEESINNNFYISKLETKKLNSRIFLKRLRLFNFLPLLSNKYKVIILIGEMQVLPTWIVMILSKLLKKKIILWGHGISIHTYLDEQKQIKTSRLLYHKLADYIWLYTEKEKVIWSKYLDPAIITSLNNTLDINKILNQETLDKKVLKEKYNIKSKITLIYCARFSLYERRTDLLVEIIKKLDSEKFSFIIIGDGKLKPDFSTFKNVNDFGAVYDDKLKNELFNIADLYIQPGWIGLSANEALAYGKPILTFKRSNEIKQCVEYAYLNNKNSFIAEDIKDMINFLENISNEKILLLQNNAKKFAKENLTLDLMALNASKSLDKIKGDIK